MNQCIQEAVDLLETLKEEDNISKKFKDKTDLIISTLTSKQELSLEKAIFLLEELNSNELNSFYRAQLWSILSTLESVHKQN
jgi:uncharacterized protein (UPF0147 family)